jgi:hypothetical protein
VARHLHGPQIEDEITDLEAGGGEAAGSSHQRAHARYHFLHAEWFADIVVRAGLDALHPFIPVAACREDQYGRVSERLAPALEHGEAVDPGEPQVEDNRVEVLAVAAIPGVLAVALDFGDKTCCLQRRLERLGQAVVVFGDKHAHRYRSVGLNALS